MLSADHPNALWLSDLYRGGAAIIADTSLDEAERARKTAEHRARVFERISPDIVIHTGGVRLAATGGREFMLRYIKRREQLTEGDVQPVEFGLILADDHYGITHGTFRNVRGGEVWTRIGMGAWRFEDGIAVEHWELSNGPKWDEWFLAADPEFEGHAIDFWTKGV
ncbi:hypothetical protein [Microbacterium sp.]|uniref:hypothetical protein n=1 Tax=Microbacterium sp. TaxID=51671 RepID=UPI002D784B1F|nr:hypothetical protein [Microbacterium sp.]HET6302203.1 hypothetical protein [Microbacterium sp.]